MNIAAIALALVLARDLPPPPVERGFSLNRSSTGYIVAGNLSGTLYAFHVRGEKLKYLGTASPPVFSIDGVVMQVKIVAHSAFGGPRAAMLQTHKRFEQEHQARSTKGVAFRDHDLCQGARYPHQQWIAQAQGGISQAYVTFEVGDNVVMVVAPYENEQRRKVVAEAIGDVCRSFATEKAAA
jgi:hypothetical protein